MSSRAPANKRRRIASESLIGGAPRSLDATARNEIRRQFRDCADTVGGEVSARVRASRLGETYLALDPDGRHEFLRILTLEFGPDPKFIEIAHTVYQSMVGSHLQWDAEAALRVTLRSLRMRILTQFNALPQGVKFLVDMRADLLGFLDLDPSLAALDREMEARLTGWFDVGFLELRRITWDSSAALLEKLIQYEAVHAIKSWSDLRHRLDSDRRCYAYFHPRMPQEPLIFVEVALTNRLAGSVQALLDEDRSVSDPNRANTAIFYSISNTQKGLRGVHFGNFLLKRVIDDLRAEFPRLKTFATLSPLPSLQQWFEDNPSILASIVATTAHNLTIPLDWRINPAALKTVRFPLLSAGARYLLEGKHDGRPFDPVARFHLGNGARVERLNWLADTSPKGLGQSYGLMVNYLYDLDRIEHNVEAYARAGTVDASHQVRKLLSGAK